MVGKGGLEVGLGVGVFTMAGFQVLVISANRREEGRAGLRSLGFGQGPLRSGLIVPRWWITMNIVAVVVASISWEQSLF